MSNGTTCCLIRACCPEPQQRAALTEFFAEKLGWSATRTEKETGNAAAAADLILDHFDLVPKGVGVAIAAGYKPFLKTK